MGNAEALRSPSLTRIIIIATGVVLAGLALTPRSAAALPTYAQRENKPCGYCHVNPAGGGDRNAIGRDYEENGHTFKK